MIGKVLMIDDDRDMCEEMSEILKDSGIEVVAVCDPVTGRKLAHEKQYDLLLLDLKMPGINGYEILRSVKDLDPQVKVMVITGAPLNKIAQIQLSAEDKYRDQTLKLADEVINKSAEIETILKKIKSLMCKA